MTANTNYALTQLAKMTGFTDAFQSASFREFVQFPGVIELSIERGFFDLINSPILIELYQLPSFIELAQSQKFAHWINDKDTIEMIKLPEFLEFAKLDRIKEARKMAINICDMSKFIKLANSEECILLSGQFGSPHLFNEYFQLAQLPSFYNFAKEEGYMHCLMRAFRDVPKFAQNWPKFVELIQLPRFSELISLRDNFWFAWQLEFVEMTQSPGFFETIQSPEFISAINEPAFIEVVTSNEFRETILTIYEMGISPRMRKQFVESLLSRHPQTNGTTS